MRQLLAGAGLLACTLSTAYTEAPVDAETVFLHVWAAVTRMSDVGVFVPEQAVSVVEALRMPAIWSARAQREDAIKGSIEPGKHAFRRL